MQLRLLTLNVWGLPAGLARHRGARMAAIGERLRDLDADVACFQEVWSSASRRALVEAGGHAGYRHVWHRGQRFAGSGLLVLSRLPLASARFSPYRLQGLPQRLQHADYYGGKGFVSLVLGDALDAATLFVTHLHAGYVPEGTPDEYRGLRTAQALQLAAAARAADGPVVMAGDFNLGERDPEYAVLLGLGGLVDAAAVLDRREPTCLAGHPYRGEDAGPLRIDLVLGRSGPRRALRFRSLRRVLDEPLEIAGERGAYSDHAGVLAELTIDPADPSRATPGHGATPDPDVVALAERLLREGMQTTRDRQGRERRLAGASWAAALAAGAGTGAAQGSRRRFLRGLLGTAAALGIGAGALLAWLGERVAADELAGYQEALTWLADLARDEPRS